jgi:hypothetical protein
MNRKGNWIQTYLGKQFWPLDPRPEDVFIEDIAHALSMICRYNGHCKQFYSVAEHSYYISCAVGKELAIYGLLHDAAEAYMADLVRPIKKSVPGFVAIENLLEQVIMARFDLVLGKGKQAIKTADNAILTDEREQNMSSTPHKWEESGPGLGVKIHCWLPPVAEQVFLCRFRSVLYQQIFI